MRRSFEGMPHRSAAAPAALLALLLATIWTASLGPVSWAAGTARASAAPASGVDRFAIDPAPSQVAYRVGETFFENNRFNTAVGVTHGIQGDIFIDRTHPKQSRIGPITVDISQFTSDSGRRDRAIRRRWLESEKYPQAVFAPTAIQGLPDTYADGRDVPVQITGALRVRDTTRPATFKGTIRLQGDVLTASASATILMTDFGFEPPSILGMLKAENQAVLELQMTARRQAAAG